MSVSSLLLVLLILLLHFLVLLIRTHVPRAYQPKPPKNTPARKASASS